MFNLKTGFGIRDRHRERMEIDTDRWTDKGTNNAKATDT